MQVAVVGGGMITHDQILPSLFQLQRLGVVSDVTVCAQHGRTLQKLAASETIRTAFPNASFHPYPSATADRDVAHPELYREVLAAMPPRNLAVVALPDPLHFEAVMCALEADQHLVVVKPLVLQAAQADRIAAEARRRGLFCGVEYHKRFDDRSLMARRKYRAGAFGEFRLGSAHLMEKWYYRRANFQSWCLSDASDAFTYIGCHYVDLVHFITGLLPERVSVYGIEDKYPNGNAGFLWTDARVIWNNGACLNVQNSLSLPDDAPGTNSQGLNLYCATAERGAMLRHSDQYRGLEYVYTDAPPGPGSTIYAEPSPDYFQYLALGGEGLTPAGYGYRSIDYLVRCALRVEAAPDRQAEIAAIDRDGLAATPANSRYNEVLIEGARESICRGGREVRLNYSAHA